MLRTILRVLASLSFVLTFAFGWIAHSVVGDIHLGTTEVVDGERLKVGSHTFRFRGITTAPVDTIPGDAAKDYLSFITTDRFVWCRHKGDVENGNYIGICYTGFEAINQRMVAEGFARDCFAYSEGRFATLEARAREMKRGLWIETTMPEPAERCRLSSEQAAEEISGSQDVDDPLSQGGLQPQSTDIRESYSEVEEPERTVPGTGDADSLEATESLTPPLGSPADP